MVRPSTRLSISGVTSAGYEKQKPIRSVSLSNGSMAEAVRFMKSDQCAGKSVPGMGLRSIFSMLQPRSPKLMSAVR